MESCSKKARVGEPHPISITYLKDGATRREEADFLVVACDPQAILDDVLKKTDEESNAFSNDVMKSVVFQTSLFKVPAGDPNKLPALRFAPKPLSLLNGSLSGYRSETRKTSMELPEGSNYELVTTYQLLDPTKSGHLTEDELARKLSDQLGNEKAPWFPYTLSPNQEPIHRYHTKYFNHFTKDAIENPELSDPWDLLSLQGHNNTMFVHASTAFESVLHIYQYIELLCDVKSEHLPKDMESRIVVLGAGPSGILAARKFAKMGYTNIKVIEKGENDTDPASEMLAGKTQTFVEEQDGKQITVELGTCYLSPAYDCMVGDLKDIQQDNSIIGLDSGYKVENVSFREIVTEGQFLDDGAAQKLYKHLHDGNGIPPYLSSDDYNVWKGFEMTEDGSCCVKHLEDRFENMEATMAKSVIEYCKIHYGLFGKSRPFPEKRPTGRPAEKLWKQNLYDFLEANQLLSLFGVLQYGYSAQGYGSTELDSNTPAFYLLVWIVPEILLAELGNKIRKKLKDLLDQQYKSVSPVVWVKLAYAVLGRLLRGGDLVTCFEKGWGDLWRQQKDIFENSGVSLVYQAEVTKIARPGI